MFIKVESSILDAGLQARCNYFGAISDISSHEECMFYLMLR